MIFAFFSQLVFLSVIFFVGHNYGNENILIIFFTGVIPLIGLIFKRNFIYKYIDFISAGVIIISIPTLFFAFIFSARASQADYVLMLVFIIYWMYLLRLNSVLKMIYVDKKLQPNDISRYKWIDQRVPIFMGAIVLSIILPLFLEHY
jgi:hypothetical protein